MLQLIIEISILSVVTIGLSVLVVYLSTKSYLEYITPQNKPKELNDLRYNLRRALIAAENSRSQDASWYLDVFSDYVISLTTYSIIDKTYNSRSGNNILIYFASILIGMLPAWICKCFFSDDLPTLLLFLPSVVYYGLALFLYHLFEKNISRFVSQYPKDYPSAKKINVPVLSFDAPQDEANQYFRALELSRQELELCAHCMKDRMEHATIARFFLGLIFALSVLVYKL